MFSKPPRARHGLVIALAAAGLGTACGTPQEAHLRDLQTIQVRVGELELANRQMQVRLDAYEASITLVEDQLVALEVAQRDQARQAQLEVVRLEPASAPEVARYGGSLGLGSSRLVEPADDEPDDAYVDIVVSNDKLQRYFGPSSPAAVTEPVVAPRPTGLRTPQPAVVIDERLPVAGGATAAKAPSAAAQPAPSDPVEYYRRGLKHYRQQEFEPAIELLNAFLQANPPADYVDNALYWLGECHYGLGQFSEAAAYFHRIVQEFPDANKVPDALLKVGLTYQRLEKPESAREVMYYLIEAYPKSDAARVARERLENPKTS